MTVATLITVILLMVGASHTHGHLKPPIKKQEELLTPTAHNLTWKVLLTYDPCAHFHHQITGYEI